MFLNSGVGEIEPIYHAVQVLVIESDDQLVGAAFPVGTGEEGRQSVGSVLTPLENHSPSG